MIVNLDDALGILISALGGAAVGLERAWSGHAKGPKARFAGIRTFTLLGLQAGLAGWFWSNQQRALAITLIVAASALILAAYVAASRVEVDGTTEVAALVVLAAGMAAGMRELQLASAVFATTTLLLIEKSRLHKMVERIDDAGLRAGFRFAVMAVVIFPMLPSGPYGPLGGVRPRQLWALVLFFSGLSFAGYVTRRFVGAERGYPVTGMLGGIISSTNVTLSFARMSRVEDSARIPLAYGVIAASAVMFVRVGIATAVLNPTTAQAVVPYFAAPFFVAACISFWGVEISRVAFGTGSSRESAAAVDRRSNGVAISASLVRRTVGAGYLGASGNFCFRRSSRIRGCGRIGDFDGEERRRSSAGPNRSSGNCFRCLDEYDFEVGCRSSYRS